MPGGCRTLPAPVLSRASIPRQRSPWITAPPRRAVATRPRRPSSSRTARATLARPLSRKGRLRGDAVDQAVASVRRLGRRRRVLRAVSYTHLTLPTICSV
eukprot:6968895-Alexandrium_andersonii.AAC.1